jgi:hypothetical protein
MSAVLKLLSFFGKNKVFDRTLNRQKLAEILLVQEDIFNTLTFFHQNKLFFLTPRKDFDDIRFGFPLVKEDVFNPLTFFNKNKNAN